MLEIIMIVLASYYLTYGVVYIDGPAEIFYKARSKSPQLIRKLLTCFFCSSVWISTIVCLIAYSGSENVILVSLAVAGAINIIDRITE